MNQPVIQVKNLTKKFKLWIERPTSIKSVMINATRGRIGMGQYQEFTCLSDISFDVQAGEFVGIMGRNGAGKSTLLKLISGIYSPSSGTVEVKGTIAPLIELGAGFHGDLTGYENIFLNAAILGFGRKAALDAAPSILEFSELGERIHMPVRTFSSGMLVRLGFAIATHLAAPIILVDEVLAVGDVGFQEKCLKKIHQLHGEGRTIVLITHDTEAVLKNCGRCIVIDRNKKVYDGATDPGVKTYLQSVHS